MIRAVADSALGGSHLVNVWFSESKRAWMPEAWNSPLPGFGPEIPGSALWGDPDLDVRSFYEAWPAPFRKREPFALVADFDGDGGASRLVVPEVIVGPGNEGYVFKWMLSPAAMQAVEAAHGEAARRHDGG